MAGEATIRKANDSDMALVSANFRKMWSDLGSEAENFREDWPDVVAAFIERARTERRFAAFAAEINGVVVGTAACQIFAGLYPEIRKSDAHLAGYVWGVYVDPPHRRMGFATELTRAAIDYLNEIGCTVVKLHASRLGEPVYRAMGFCDSNELNLALPEASPMPGTAEPDAP